MEDGRLGDSIIRTECRRFSECAQAKSKTLFSFLDYTDEGIFEIKREVYSTKVLRDFS